MSAPRRRTRATLRATEDEVQISIVDRWRRLKTAEQIGEGYTLFSIRNEAQGSKSRGGKLFAMGRHKGIPDLAISAPGGRIFHGETKNEIGRLSVAQREYREHCVKHAIPWALWRSQDEAERSWREWGIFAEKGKQGER